MKILIRTAGATLLLALAGCGDKDPRAPVSGKVTVAGKDALPGGTIQFVAVGDPNRSGSGKIKADGSYEVTDAPVGECKVVIVNSHLDTEALKKGGASLPGAGPGPGGMGGMKGAPGKASAPPGGAGPSKEAKEKMAGGPKGADVAPEMVEGQKERAAERYVRIDAGFGKADSTPLKATVQKGENTGVNFEVK